jgi:hypothetical protein
MPAVADRVRRTAGPGGQGRYRATGRCMRRHRRVRCGRRGAVLGRCPTSIRLAGRCHVGPNSDSRDGWLMAAEAVKSGKADGVVVARIDRPARDVMVQEYLLRNLSQFDGVVLWPATAKPRC